MRAAVIANGELPSIATARAFAGDADLVVAADGGADKALALGLRVDVVLGDFDSIGEGTRSQLGEARLRRDADENRTDLQKAVEHCIAAGATRIDILAAGGGRADHALANLSMLTAYRGRAEVHVVDDLFDISLVDGKARVEAPAGTVVSLVAIGQCRGVTTTGMRWDLTDYPLAFSPYGVHNEVAHSPATVAVRAGDLLLFTGRWVERHL